MIADKLVVSRTGGRRRPQRLVGSFREGVYVPDQQTRELMEDSYQRLLEGQPRVETLREAQLAMKERNPDPLYWGAFICQGNPGELPRHGLRGQP